MLAFERVEMRSPRVGVPALSHGRLPQRLTGVRTSLRFIATLGKFTIEWASDRQTRRSGPISRCFAISPALKIERRKSPIQILIVERGETERYPPQGSRRTSGQPTAMVSDGRACRAGRSASGSRT